MPPLGGRRGRRRSHSSGNSQRRSRRGGGAGCGRRGEGMASPSYGIDDAVALALAVILAAAMLMISSLLLPDLADLMPPPLSGML